MTSVWKVKRIDFGDCGPPRPIVGATARSSNTMQSGCTWLSRKPAMTRDFREANGANHSRRTGSVGPVISCTPLHRRPVGRQEPDRFVEVEKLKVGAAAEVWSAGDEELVPGSGGIFAQPPMPANVPGAHRGPQTIDP